MKFSVLMSVYKNDRVAHVKQAIDSIINQTVKPDEIVIVIDGKVPDATEYELKQYQNIFNFMKLVWLPVNVGLGAALREGLQYCSHELVARMDSDDISMPTRFEKQLECFGNNEEISLVGTNISEFICYSDNIVSYRKVPLEDQDIKRYMKTRSPFNHMSVMFKKSDVEKCGSYMHWYLNEDYYLWIRMFLAGCTFANLNETLVNVRINEDTFRRRGGWSYFLTQKRIFDFMLKNKMINIFDYFYNNSVRFVTRLMLPNKVRKWLYIKLLRG
ncbi:glycosyltransferase [Paenibacillus sp. URB8-2]|uniref:glycosyltransferase n=1 Tax=Paenibacillus sp. URB8-2 TaxID=2741301 RepID=UPI0015C1D50E|nr:glycosyltransferase [Paenibacillus sp. URB8-2]BCG60551.1 glycosyl transferase [Paenibacillus sp. URB8-2]